MKYSISLAMTVVFSLGGLSCAQAEDFFAPAAPSTLSPQASQASQASTSSSGNAAAEQDYQAWLQQYQQLQQKTLQQMTIDPSQYNLPMPHQTGNRQQLQGAQ